MQFRQVVRSGLNESGQIDTLRSRIINYTKAEPSRCWQHCVLGTYNWITSYTIRNFHGIVAALHWTVYRTKDK